MDQRETESTVACVTGDDKFRVFQEVMEHSRFFHDIEERFKRSRKDREAFKIAIKPNFMVFLTQKDPSSYTDPELADFLIERLLEKGFREIFVVESRNVLGKWYHNREVATVASACGYQDKGYRLIDLTLDAVSHTFEGVLGNHFVGRAWKEADYRISFAKNKTHPANRYTLAMKNIFGVTPCEDKYYEYHKLREWDAATMDMLKAFPVHFGFIDAFISADGVFGFRGDKTPKDTRTILGSRNLLALDWVGATKMGLDPMESILMRVAVGEWGRPVFDFYGNNEPYEDWDNTPFLLDRFDDTLEEIYCIHSFLTHLIMYEPDPIFKERHRGFFEKTRKILGLD